MDVIEKLESLASTVHFDTSDTLRQTKLASPAHEDLRCQVVIACVWLFFVVEGECAASIAKPSNLKREQNKFLFKEGRRGDRHLSLQGVA